MSNVRGPLNSVETETSILTGAVYNAVPPSPADGQQCALQLDANGNLKTTGGGGGGGGGAVTGTHSNNTAPPGSDNLGVLPAVANAANPTWTEGDQVLVSEDLSGNLRVKVNAAIPAGTNVIGHVIADSGSTTVVTGTVTVSGDKTNNNAAPGATNVGVLPAIANAAAQTWTEGDQVLLSEDLSGNLRVSNVFISASFPDGVTRMAVPANSGSLIAAVPSLLYGYNGVDINPLRFPNVYKTSSVAATSTGNTAIWTPVTGNKFRLMRFQITAQGLAATTSAVVTVSFQDSTTAITIGTYDVDVPAIANVASGVNNISCGWIDLANGYLSLANNNVLNFNISAAGAGTVGTYRINLCGLEAPNP